ncbi:MAG: NAD(P)H-binding protein [Bifidobacterium sp.]|uniref:NAD(P)H-binding protein n=1 Tax=Bifidobacterium fermentum TaxID=3059035 RepID=A0AB39UPS2_9BIFI
MRVLILGAAGRVPSFLIPMLLERTDNDLVLFARRAANRIVNPDTQRVSIVEGDFGSKSDLLPALQGVEAVYLNEMGDPDSVANVVETLQESRVNRLIGSTVLGIYHEVQGKFGAWNTAMVGGSLQRYMAAAAMVENSSLNYTLLRLTWLYDQTGNTSYGLTRKGELFKGAQVTRQAVAQLIMDILTDGTHGFDRASLGVGEPGTDFDKPSFY